MDIDALCMNHIPSCCHATLEPCNGAGSAGNNPSGMARRAGIGTARRSSARMGSAVQLEASRLPRALPDLIRILPVPWVITSFNYGSFWQMSTLLVSND